VVAAIGLGEYAIAVSVGERAAGGGLICCTSDATLVKRYTHRIAAGPRHPGHTEATPAQALVDRIVQTVLDSV